MYKMVRFKITEVVLQRLFLIRGVGVTQCVQNPTVLVFEIETGCHKEHFSGNAK